MAGGKSRPPLYLVPTGGLYLIMEKKSILKKNPCPDCTFCQYCSQTRCSMCLPKGCKKKKEKTACKAHKPLFRSY